MKFDVEQLKNQINQTILEVLEKRRRAPEEAARKIREAQKMTEEKYDKWEAWIRKVQDTVSASLEVPGHELMSSCPPSWQGALGGTYQARELQKASEKSPSTEVPKRLERFLKFLEMASAESVSTNELKTHGFANLDDILNSRNYS